MPVHRLLRVIRTSLTAGCVFAVASAQELDELNTLVPESLAAMKAEKWEDALGLLTKTTAMRQEEALRLFGPQYGVIWYRRGICEMRLKRWDAAIRSFETCYRDYPNRGPSGGNTYQTKALLKWGESAVGAKRWEIAISRFRKFLVERDKVRDKFQQGPFYVTLGVCHFRLGQIPEGNEQLEIAIRNRETFPTTPDQIVAGIQALAAAAIEGKSEAALLDFLTSNQSALSFEPHLALAYSAVYLKLASDAAASGMHRAALAFYELVLDPQRASSELKERLAASGANPPELAAALKQLEENSFSETPIGPLRLAGQASAQEALGNRPLACETRERLARDYPDSPLREENLQRLTSIRVGLAQAAEREGRIEEAISGYEKACIEGKGRAAAVATTRWMELVWNRNLGGDRLSACRGGLSYLEATQEQEAELSAEEHLARDEVAKLVRSFQAKLTAKVEPAP